MRPLHFDVDRFLEALIGDLHPRAVFPARLEVAPDRLVVEQRELELADVEHVHVLGLGKASVPQVEVVDGLLRDVFGTRMTQPLAVTKRGQGASSGSVEVLEAAHPVCDESSLRAADALLSRVQRTARDDLIVLCLSGGGSALATAPRPPFTLSDVEEVTAALLRGGASIEALNLVRRELSRIKNGGLLHACGARRVLTLITSDVPGRDLALVASGPTLFRPIDDGRLLDVVDRHLRDPLRQRILAQLEDPARARWLAELRDAAASKDATAVVVADYDYLIERVRVRLLGLGVERVTAFPDALDLPIDEGVERHLEALPEALARDGRFALVSGGELPVPVTGDGEGGRNTEFVLRLARALFVDRRLPIADAELRRLRVLSFATDGGDGPTDCAGGFLTLDDVERADGQGLDLEAHLRRNDSLGYLRAIGCALKTGPTATNLMDLRVISRG